MLTHRSSRRFVIRLKISWLGERGTQIAGLLLATPVVLWCGLPFFERGLASLKNRSPNMWTLIGTGVGAAYLYSVAATLVPGWFPESFREHGRVGVYFEAAAVIVTLVLLGEVLQLRAMGETSQAVRKLLHLAPHKAWRLRPDGSEEQVDLQAIRPGERSNCPSAQRYSMATVRPFGIDACSGLRRGGRLDETKLAPFAATVLGA